MGLLKVTGQLLAEGVVLPYAGQHEPRGGRYAEYRQHTCDDARRQPEQDAGKDDEGEEEQRRDIGESEGQEFEGPHQVQYSDEHAPADPVPQPPACCQKDDGPTATAVHGNDGGVRVRVIPQLSQRARPCRQHAERDRYPENYELQGLQPVSHQFLQFLQLQ